MAPGVAAVMVQILGTKDGEALLNHLGDTAIAQAARMEAAFGKAGAAMSASMGDTASAIDVALASSKEYQVALDKLAAAEAKFGRSASEATDKALAGSKKYLDQLGLVDKAQENLIKRQEQAKVAGQTANDALIASTRELEAAQKAYNDSVSAGTAARLAGARKAAAEAEAQVAAAERKARMIPAAEGEVRAATGEAEATRLMIRGQATRSFEGGVGAAQAGVLAAKTSATREAEAQLALSERNAAAYAKQQEALGKFSAFGGKALAGLAAATVVVGVEAIKMGKGFEDAQRKFEGATGKGERGPTGGRALSAEFEKSSGKQQSGQELEGAYASVSKQIEITQGHAIKAGEAYKFMTSASNLQAASGEKLKNVTNDLASVMQVYKIKMGDAAETSNKMFNASRLVNTSVDSMTSLVTKLHARLGDIGGGLNQVLGLMSEAASFGLTGGRGVLIFNQALERMTSSSKPVTETLEHLNVHLHNSKDEFVGMPSVVEQLHRAYEKLTPAQREFATQQLFGKGATGEFTEIIRNGKGGLEQFTQAALKHGEVERAAAKSNETLSGQLKILWSTVETAGGALGHTLVPQVKAFVSAIKDAGGFVEKHNGLLKALATTITLVVGGAISIFVYDKAVAFGKGVERMGAGLAGLLGQSRVTAAGIEADAAATSGAIEAEATSSSAAMGGMAAADEAAAASIKATNAGIGASFTGLLGPIGIAAAAILTLKGPAEEVGRTLRKELGLEDQQFPQAAPSSVPRHPIEPGQPGVSLWSGHRGSSDQFPFIEAIATKFGISPHTLWGIYGTETSYGGNISTSSTGAKGAFQFMPETAKAYGLSPKDLSNKPNAAQFQRQAEAAARYIQALTHKYHSEGKAVEAYYGNQGSLEAQQYRARVEEHGGSHYGHLTAEQRERMETEAAHGGNPALQRQKEEREHGKAKKTEAQKEKEAAERKRRKFEREGSINPFAYAHGLTQTREDMGVDYSMHVGDRIVAPGTGYIDKIIPNWYTDEAGKSQPLIEEKITAGKDKGMYFYVAEQIDKKVKEGQKVTAGQVLATFAATGSGVEAGLGAGGGLTLAQSRHEFHDHAGNDPTRASGEFKKFMSGLGKGLGGIELSGANSAFEKAQKAAEAISKSGTDLYKKFEDNLQSGTVRTLDKLLGVSAKDPTGKRSVQFAQLQMTEGSLRAAGQGELADKLVKVHKEALQLLRESITAQGRERLAQQLTIETTHLKDLADDAQKTAATELTIAKDKATQAADASKASSQALADAAAEFKSKTDVVITELADAAKTMSDEFAGTAQKSKDASDIKVKELEERGKYGLNLQAQREEVALAQMKLSYDQQIQQEKVALDQLRTAEDHLVATDQLGVTTITAKENALVAAAQAALDAEKIAQDTNIQTAQQAVSAAQTHTDNQVGNDLTKAVAEALLGEKRAAQNILQAKLKDDEAKGKKAVEEASIALGRVTTAAEKGIEGKESALSAANSTREDEITKAQNTLTEAETTARELIQKAQSGLEKIEGEANLKETEAQGKIEIRKAEASTQYAGSGLVVNFTNIPPNDATAIQSELGFLMRHLLPA